MNEKSINDPVTLAIPSAYYIAHIDDCIDSESIPQAHYPFRLIYEEREL